MLMNLLLFRWIKGNRTILLSIAGALAAALAAPEIQALVAPENVKWLVAGSYGIFALLRLDTNTAPGKKQ